MRASFAWRLYLSYAALVLVTSLSIGFLVHERLRDSLEHELERSLLDSGVALEQFGRQGLADRSMDFAGVLGGIREETQLRITLIDADGVVIADSHEAPAEMENHAQRVEIREAAENGTGFSRRFSRTLRYSMLYAARALHAEDGHVLGYLRVSLPLVELQSDLRGVRRDIVAGGGLGIALALLLGLWMTRRITAPIREMTEVADALRGGDYSRRISVLPENELGGLGATLNRLAGELTRRIQAISRDDVQLRAILVAMVEGVLAVDDDDRLLFSNASARELMGIAPGEAAGPRLWEVARHAALIELLDEVRETGAVARREFEVVGPSGNRRVLQALANPFETEHERGLVVVLHEITELRRLEHVRRDFVANVSHELKTPLTSIQGYVETLLDGALEDEGVNERFVRKVEANTQRLNFLVNDLLSLARIETSGDALPLAPVDLWRVVSAVAPRYEAAWGRKRLAVSWLGKPSDAVVRGESEGLVQIVDNLLTNAIRYARAEGRIVVRVSADEEHGILEVEDDGIGIPQAEQDRIFERFYRVDKARSRELGGTGLGLSIVKHLVAAMGGTITVKSEPGQGSTFTVRIPRA